MILIRRWTRSSALRLMGCESDWKITIEPPEHNARSIFACPRDITFPNSFIRAIWTSQSKYSPTKDRQPNKVICRRPYRRMADETEPSANPEELSSSLLES